MSVATTAADPRGEAGFYVERYGRIEATSDPRVRQAEGVFMRVRRAADRNGRRPARLIVVNSNGEPWAAALPDGHIVLTRRALAVCESMREHAQACLAFVIGHELAHLAADDFWHRDVRRFLATTPDAEGVNAFVRQHEGAATRELAADDRGYVHAALAGFDVRTLSESDEPNFFQQWMAQTNARVSASHASAATRAALVRARLADIDAKLAFFQFGVRLAHFDYCDDAVYFLREFQRVFPGREVLNNLGYCHLQMARQAMAPARAQLYWMPQLLDGQTRAGAGGARDGRIVRSLRQASRGTDTATLELAVELLERAARADRQYLPARINLAVAQLYLGRPHAARAALDEAHKLAPGDGAVQALTALALYEQGDADLDLWPKAAKRLEKLLANTPPGTPQAAMVRFNLARLLAVGPRPSEARPHFSQLAGQAAQLPAPIRVVVCKEQKRVEGKQCKRTMGSGRAGSKWPWPLAATGMRKLDPAQLADFTSTPFDWFAGRLNGHIYRRTDGTAEVLELDGFTHMQVLHGTPLARERDLPRYCAGALRQRSLGVGTAWSCGPWAAIVRDGLVSEAWWVAQ